MSARCVPKLSSFDRDRRVEVCGDLKKHYEREDQDFLNRIITCDEISVHHFITEFKRVSTQWKHTDLPPPKKFRTVVSAGIVKTRVFWDKQGIIHVVFLPHGVTVKS